MSAKPAGNPERHLLVVQAARLLLPEQQASRLHHESATFDNSPFVI
jgi:hypothetical protein